ncbi:hypothetical protein BC834DRAFT_992386 [Gloeopeniophorella convolvens]|nr:hypothetical protein BC834DRAFT_992386 [Gloeopeniophorella convolvens]
MRDFGGEPHENPMEFLRFLNRFFMTSTKVASDKEKARYFSYCLASGSPADEWFAGLPKATADDWVALEPAFQAWWAPPQAIAKTDTEKTEELQGHKLDANVLGERVQFRGVSTFSHIAWADEALIKATACGLESRNEYLRDVLRNLPNALQAHVPSASLMTWTTFTAAVKVIDVEMLQRTAREERERQAQAERLENLSNQYAALSAAQAQAQTQAQANHVDPTVALLQAQMGRLAIQHNQNVQQPVTVTTSQPTQAGQPTGGGGVPRLIAVPTAFNQRPPRAPMTETAKAELRQRLMAYPHQPNNPAGKNTYQQQLAQWHASRVPTAPVTELTPVPLKPGTSVICSGECYSCGAIGHNARDCVHKAPHPNALTAEECHGRVFSKDSWTI